jgi:hypothetical protein
LLKAYIDRASDFAFPPPPRLTRSLPRRAAQAAASWAGRLRRVSLIRVFAPERFLEALQFKNKRSALGPDALAVRLVNPTRPGPTVM